MHDCQITRTKLGAAEGCVWEGRCAAGEGSQEVCSCVCTRAIFLLRSATSIRWAIGQRSYSLIADEDTDMRSVLMTSLILCNSKLMQAWPDWRAVQQDYALIKREIHQEYKHK